MSFYVPALIVPGLFAGIIAFVLAGYVFQKQNTVFDTRGLVVFLFCSGLSSVLLVCIYAWLTGFSLFTPTLRNIQKYYRN